MTAIYVSKPKSESARFFKPISFPYLNVWGVKAMMVKPGALLDFESSLTTYEATWSDKRNAWVVEIPKAPKKIPKKKPSDIPDWISPEDALIGLKAPTKKSPIKKSAKKVA